MPGRHPCHRFQVSGASRVFWHGVPPPAPPTPEGSATSRSSASRQATSPDRSRSWRHIPASADTNADIHFGGDIGGKRRRGGSRPGPRCRSSTQRPCARSSIATIRATSSGTTSTSHPHLASANRGHSSIVSARPGSASGRSRMSSNLADPVNRKRPGRGSRSTSRLIDSSNSGTRCTSAMRSSPSWRTKPDGSSTAAARTPGSSRNSA